MQQKLGVSVIMLIHKNAIRWAVAVLAISAPPTASATFTSSVSGDRLILTQTVDSGPVVVGNNGAGGAFQVIEGGATTFVVANSLKVIMLNNSNLSLIIDFDNSVVRDVIIDLGNGARALDFSGTDNTIGGFLKIIGGSGRSNRGAGRQCRSDHGRQPGH